MPKTPSSVRIHLELEPRLLSLVDGTPEFANKNKTFNTAMRIGAQQIERERGLRWDPIAERHEKVRK